MEYLIALFLSLVILAILVVLLKNSAKREVAWEVEQTRNANARMHEQYLTAMYGTEE